MANCCGILVFTVWELMVIVAGLIALATNTWIAPESNGTRCLLGVQSAGLWTVCSGNGSALKSCGKALELNTSNIDAGETIKNQLTQITTQINEPSSWIFTSSDECTPITDQKSVEKYYSSLPVGATDAKNYWLYIQSMRGLVAGFCGLGFLIIICVAAHKPGRGGAAGCAQFFKSLQVSAGLCAIGLFVGMLTGIGQSNDFVWSDFGESIEDGWKMVAGMWGWSWWLFVGAVAWSILGWIVMCIIFCSSRGKY